MKSKLFMNKYSNWIKIFVIVVIIAYISWTMYLWSGFPHGETREYLTIDEAQALVVFPICTPAYTPSIIDSAYKIVYDADDAKNPEVTYIRLQYFDIENRQINTEIYQRFTSKTRLSDNYSERAQETAKINLYYWIVAYPDLRFASVNDVTKGIQISAESLQFNAVVWWLYEIVAPNQYRSIMTTWIVNNVEYRILSFLPVEEIKKVTISMLECSTQQNIR